MPINISGEEIEQESEESDQVSLRTHAVIRMVRPDSLSWKTWPAILNNEFGHRSQSF